jgi:hypothetical protein
VTVCAVCGRPWDNRESDPHGVFGYHDFTPREEPAPASTPEPPEPSGSDPVATLALCKWLRDRLKDWEAEAKAHLALLQGERKAAVVGGQVVGHVTMAKGRRTARVANDAALLAYVKDHYPTEVEAVEQVRPAFLKQLLDGASKKGALVDSDGVVIDGLIDVVDGDPYPMSKLLDDADIVIAGMLNRGELGVNGLKDREAGAL